MTLVFNHHQINNNKDDGDDRGSILPTPDEINHQATHSPTGIRHHTHSPSSQTEMIDNECR